jgi:hypothetical protein
MGPGAHCDSRISSPTRRSSGPFWIKEFRSGTLGETARDTGVRQRLHRVPVAGLDQRGAGLEVEDADGRDRRVQQQVDLAGAQRRPPVPRAGQPGGPAHDVEHAGHWLRRAQRVEPAGEHLPAGQARAERRDRHRLDGGGDVDGDHRSGADLGCGLFALKRIMRGQAGKTQRDGFDEVILEEYLTAFNVPRIRLSSAQQRRRALAAVSIAC